MAEANTRTQTKTIDNDETASLLGVKSGVETAVFRGNGNHFTQDRVKSQEVTKRLREATEPLSGQISLLVDLVNSLKDSQSATSREGNTSASRNVERPRCLRRSELLCVRTKMSGVKGVTVK